MVIMEKDDQQRPPATNTKFLRDHKHQLGRLTALDQAVVAGARLEVVVARTRALDDLAVLSATTVAMVAMLFVIVTRHIAGRMALSGLDLPPDLDPRILLDVSVCGGTHHPQVRGRRVPTVCKA